MKGDICKFLLELYSIIESVSQKVKGYSPSPAPPCPRCLLFPVLQEFFLHPEKLMGQFLTNGIGLKEGTMSLLLLMLLLINYAYFVISSIKIYIQSPGFGLRNIYVKLLTSS